MIPQELYGATEEDIASLWQTAGPRAFLRRAVRQANIAFAPEAEGASQREAGFSQSAADEENLCPP